jgi:hypothetical protein
MKVIIISIITSLFCYAAISKGEDNKEEGLLIEKN